MFHCCPAEIATIFFLVFFRFHNTSLVNRDKNKKTGGSVVNFCKYRGKLRYANCIDLYLDEVNSCDIRTL